MGLEVLAGKEIEEKIFDEYKCTKFRRECNTFATENKIFGLAGLVKGLVGTRYRLCFRRFSGVS